MQAATLVPSLLKINPHSVWRRQAVDLEPPDPSAFDIHEICLGTAVDDAAIYPASMPLVASQDRCATHHAH